MTPLTRQERREVDRILQGTQKRLHQLTSKQQTVFVGLFIMNNKHNIHRIDRQSKWQKFKNIFKISRS